MTQTMVDNQFLLYTCPQICKNKRPLFPSTQITTVGSIILPIILIHAGLLHTRVYFTHWFTSHTGLLHTLVYFTHWFTSHTGLLHTLVYFTHGFTSHTGLLHTRVYFTHGFTSHSHQKWQHQLQHQTPLLRIPEQAR